MSDQHTPSFTHRPTHSALGLGRRNHPDWLDYPFAPADTATAWAWTQRLCRRWYGLPARAIGLDERLFGRLIRAHGTPTFAVSALVRALAPAFHAAHRQRQRKEGPT
jgi:hypothetical protein